MAAGLRGYCFFGFKFQETCVNMVFYEGMVWFKAWGNSALLAYLSYYYYYYYHYFLLPTSTPFSWDLPAAGRGDAVRPSCGYTSLYLACLK